MTYPKPPHTKVGNDLVNTWKNISDKQRAVVLHITAGGTLPGVDSWFDNPTSSTKVGYCVDRDGTTHEYVNPESTFAGFAHGIVQGPTSAAFKALHAEAGFRSPNYWAKVGIEHIGHNLIDEFSRNQAMFEASTSLTAWACDRFGIPADKNHILGHYEIDAINRVSCPAPAGLARDRMFALYIERVREKLAGPTEDEMDELARNDINFEKHLERQLSKARLGLSSTPSEQPDRRLVREAIVELANLHNLDPNAPRVTVTIAP